MNCAFALAPINRSITVLIIIAFACTPITGEVVSHRNESTTVKLNGTASNSTSSRAAASYSNAPSKKAGAHAVAVAQRRQTAEP